MQILGDMGYAAPVPVIICEEVLCVIAADKNQAAAIDGSILTHPCYASNSYFYETLVLFHRTVVISREICSCRVDLLQNSRKKHYLRRILGAEDHLFIVSVSTRNNYIVISGGHLG